MKAYATTSANVTGAFPVTVAKNSSTGTSTDGTPYLADYITDTWVPFQALLDRCGMTPSGNVEAYTAVGSGNASGQGAITGSTYMQHMLSMQYHFGAPGEIVFDFIQGVNALPATRRVMAFTGQNIDGFLYPDLWYNTWCGSAANATAVYFFTSSSSSATYATASAARSTTGLTVNGVTGGRYLFLPDLRGLSPIGLGINSNPWGNPGGAAVNGTAFAGGSSLGAILTDIMQGHLHSIAVNSGTGLSQVSNYFANTFNNNISTSGPIADGTNGTPRVGAYTRTPGFACNIGIRF
jgi:hypothetical protein